MTLERRKPFRRQFKMIYDWIEALILALILFTFAFTFLCRMVSVDGPSMETTLENNDRLLICNIGYTPGRGDIVVIYRNEYEEPLIKRVIAIAGDNIYIDAANNAVYVNGDKRDESAYVHFPQGSDISWNPGAAVDVPEGKLFVMGDHRNNSMDSRSSSVGLVDVEAVMGRVFFRIAPAEKIGLV